MDTLGIPIEVVLESLKDHGMMPDWLDFYRAAVQAGWHPERTLHRLEEAIGDVYGPEFRVGWVARFMGMSSKG